MIDIAHCQPKLLGFVASCNRVIHFLCVEWQQHQGWCTRSATHEVYDVSLFWKLRCKFSKFNQASKRFHNLQSWTWHQSHEKACYKSTWPRLGEIQGAQNWFRGQKIVVRVKCKNRASITPITITNVFRSVRLYKKSGPIQMGVHWGSCFDDC
jgi:hypothetical protein